MWKVRGDVGGKKVWGRCRRVYGVSAEGWKR